MSVGDILEPITFPMGKKSKKSDEPQTGVLPNDPAIQAMHSISLRWAKRFEDTSTMLQEAAHALKSFSLQVETCRQGIEDLHAESELLSTLKLEELLEKRSPSVALRPESKKSRRSLSKERSTGNQTGQPEKISSLSISMGENESTLCCLPSIISSWDEKRKARVTSALHQLYWMPVSTEQAGQMTIKDDISTPEKLSLTHSSDSGQIFLEAVNVPQSRPAIHVVPTQNPDLQSAMGNAFGTDTSSTVSQKAGALAAGVQRAACPRRPREVPAPLWDEVNLLRQRRTALEDLLVQLSSSLSASLVRFDRLIESRDVARYAWEGAQTQCKKMITEYHEEQKRMFLDVSANEGHSVTTWVTNACSGKAETMER